MKIEVAKHTGFCMGVQKAILRVVRELNRHDTLQVYGPLIHNPQTISILEARGMETVNDIESITLEPVVIRTHGVPIEDTRKLKSLSEKVINLTCPRVAKVQAIIKKHSNKGYVVIIAGDRNHAEVKGLMSFAKSGVVVINSADEIPPIPDSEHYLLVAQTTIERERFYSIHEALEAKDVHPEVINTICDSTRDRQNFLIDRLSSEEIDKLVVVGGKNSSNTKKLASIGREHNIDTHHIETEDELEASEFKETTHTLVVAGASTPGWIINNVLEKLYSIKNSHRNPLSGALISAFTFLTRTSLLASAVSAIFYLLWNDVVSGTIPLFYGYASFIFLFVMYTVNNIFDITYIKSNNRIKYLIYSRYGKALVATSILLTILLALLIGDTPMGSRLLYFAGFLGGLLYAAPIVRNRILPGLPGVIRKLYSVKIITSLGWLYSLWIIPLYTFMSSTVIKAPLLVAALPFYVFSIIFMRHLLIDLIAVQGDLIMGRESLPVVMGEKLTRKVAWIVMIAGGLSSLLFLLMSGNIAYGLLLIPIAYYLKLFSVVVLKEYMITLKYEMLTDLNLVITAFVIGIIHIIGLNIQWKSLWNLL